MGVYISNWKMPSTCADCEIITRSSWTNETHCPFTGMYKHKDKRAINCPLIEVKTPHGQLIDKDEFAKVIVINGVDVEFINKATGLLMNVQSIIEAETE